MIRILKISASLLQPKGCKNDAHDDTLTFKLEKWGGGRGGNGGGRVDRVEEEWSAYVRFA